MSNTTLTVIPLFPCAVLEYGFVQHDSLNTSLAQFIEEEKRRSPGLQKTNLGGWHSTTDLQSRENAAIEQFLRLLKPALNAWAEQFFTLSRPLDAECWQIELWANVNEHGHLNKAHNHFRKDIVAAGFYYVRYPGEDLGGETVFINQQARPTYVDCDIPLKTPEWVVVPKNGRGYIFPSWMGHEVRLYRGQQSRVSLAFNAGHPDLPLTKYGDNPRLPRLRAWFKRMLNHITPSKRATY